jgi:adenosylcobyric acid synthase
VTAAFDRLRDAYDIIVMEGAGSPAEINLRAGDITNMRMALYANAPVLLAGDIDRGGVFAALVGTMVLLEPEERALVRGFLVNKFRGDVSLLGDGLQMLRERAYGVPTLGVIPYLENLGIAEEDAAPLEYLRDPDHPDGTGMVRLAIVRLPRMSNFDEFDALRREPGVSTRFADQPEDLEGVDAAILPGSKMTIPDLEWLVENGWTEQLHRVVERGGSVVGLCGGYQLLGEELLDPDGVESTPGTRMDGLGLLSVRTVFEPEKVTELTAAQVVAGEGWLEAVAGTSVRGYQIHTGRSEMTGACDPLLALPDGPDGASAPGGRVWGCYLHGIFENDDFRHAWLRSLGWQGEGIAFDREAAYDRLANHVRQHVEMERISAIMDEHQRR